MSRSESANPQPDPGSNYLHAFGELESTVRLILHAPEEAPLGQLLFELERLSPSLSRTIRDIRDLTKVRNLIAHGTDRVGRVLPTVDTFDALNNCLRQLKFLTEGVKTFLKPIREFSDAEPLSHALKFMHESDFSQIIVRREDRHVDVLSAIDMADWLTGKIEDDLIQLSDHRVGDVVGERRSRRFVMLALSSTVGDVQTEFSRAAHRDYDNLFCVVLTQSGRGTEKALGIVTPWDLMHERDGESGRRR